MSHIFSKSIKPSNSITWIKQSSFKSVSWKRDGGSVGCGAGADAAAWAIDDGRRGRDGTRGKRTFGRTIVNVDAMMVTIWMDFCLEKDKSRNNNVELDTIPTELQQTEMLNNNNSFCVIGSSGNCG